MGRVLILGPTPLGLALFHSDLVQQKFEFKGQDFFPLLSALSMAFYEGDRVLYFEGPLLFEAEVGK